MKHIHYYIYILALVCGLFCSCMDNGWDVPGTDGSEFGNQAITESNLVSIAQLKMQYAGIISIYIQTNLASARDRHYSRQAYARLNIRTCDTTELLSAGLRVLNGIFAPGYLYYKAGVILEDLSASRESQMDLFDAEPESEELREKRAKLQMAVDRLNARKQNTVFLAAQGMYARSGISRQERKSPAYTTSWKDVPKVK